MALAKPQTTQSKPAPEKDEEQLTEQGVQATADAAKAEEQQADTAPATEQSEPEAQAADAEASDAKAKEVAEAKEPEPPEPEPEQNKQVATASSANAVATAKERFEGDMAQHGYEGLNLGGMSFEQIRLPGEGQFLIGQDDQELGKEFDCVVQSTRSRYVVRQSNEEDADMFYSYDPKGLVNSEGEDMSDKLQEWKEDGYDKPVIKKYIEAMAIMVNDEERHGMMVILSISPSSVQKFSGFTAQQQFMKKQLPHEYITRCVVGTKVKRDGGSSFFPWNFKNAGPAPADLF